MLKKVVHHSLFGITETTIEENEPAAEVRKKNLRVQKKSDAHVLYKFTEHLNIHPSYSVQWNKVTKKRTGGRSEAEDEAEADQKDTKHTRPQKFYYDYLSKLSAKKVRRAVEWLYLFSELKRAPATETHKAFYFRLNFLTITLSSAQMHSDKYITEHLLQPLLMWLKRKYNVNSYLWKAEIQNNGNIHYHITTNKFIDKIAVNRKWNSIQENHGYVKVHPVTKEVYNPPSTDIKAVKNESELGNYLGGYYSKKDEYCKVKTQDGSRYATLKDFNLWEQHFYQDENGIEATKYEGAIPVVMKRVVHGRLWSCSESLSNIKCFISEDEEDYYNAKTVLTEQVSDKEVSIDFAKIYLHSREKKYKHHPLIRNKIWELYHKFYISDN